jgi:hypothetical protein
VLVGPSTGGDQPDTEVGGDAAHNAFSVGGLPTHYLVNLMFEAAEAQSAYEEGQGHDAWSRATLLGNIQSALSATSNGERTTATYALRNRILRTIYADADDRAGTRQATTERVNAIRTEMVKEGEVAVGFQKGDAADETTDDAAAMDSLAPSGPISY